MENALSTCNNSSPGLDLIPFALLKMLPKNVKIVKLKIFNEFKQARHIPKSWYDCKVVAILKPNKVPRSGNSTLLSTKIDSLVYANFTKSCCTRVIELKATIIELKATVSATQLGFQKGFSTQDCLAILVTDLAGVLAKKSCCLAIFMDVSSAYDDVQIDILCQIILRLNIQSQAVELVFQLFSKRNLYFYVYKSHWTQGAGTRIDVVTFTLQHLYNIH